MEKLSENYKLSEELEKELSDQMAAEFYSSHLYLAISHSFAKDNLKGCACWFKKQAEEECTHATMFLDLFLRLGITPSFGGIKQVPLVPNNIEGILSLALSHEKTISDSIHKIYKLAKSEENILVCNFLKWFVNEQLEEENGIIELQDLYSHSQKQEEFNMDHELSERCKGD